MRRHRAPEEPAAAGRGQPGAASFPVSAGSLGEEQPLVGRLRGSSPAHRELQLLPGKGSA